MSFLVPAALAIAFLVALPIAAHLLRAGRVPTRAFPPARWVETTQATHQRRRRQLRDRPLLITRCVSLLVLAALGAVPLIRCSGLSLQRSSGEAIALAIVLDNSESMRAAVHDSDISVREGSPLRSPDEATTRWERARTAAQQLLLDTESGDVVTLVSAGTPASIALGATSDLEAARQALETIQLTDRATNLEEAIHLARKVLQNVPQQDRRIVVLSDFAAPLPELPSDTELPFFAPLTALQNPAPNCALLRAQQLGPDISVTVACNLPEAAQQRRVQVSLGAQLLDVGPLKPQAGVQVLSGAEPQTDTSRARSDQGRSSASQGSDLSTEATRTLRQAGSEALIASLTGRDAIAHDDVAPVSSRALLRRIAVVSSARPPTGGAPLVEQALTSLGQVTWDLQQLPSAPEALADLKGVELLVLDDPPGLSPEATATIATWTRNGGVALLFLGPNAGKMPLGSSLSPFSKSAVRWQPQKSESLGIPHHERSNGSKRQVGSIQWPPLRLDAFQDLAPQGRALLGAQDREAESTLGTWDDGLPFLKLFELGRGLLITAGLPSSTEISDFALRPGFLALLRQALEETRQRHGERESLVGVPWRILSTDQPKVFGPLGKLNPKALGSDKPCTGDCPDVNLWSVTPNLAGRYRIETSEGDDTRIARLAAEEALALPSPKLTAASTQTSDFNRERTVELSRWFSMLLLALLALEFSLRSGRIFTQRKEKNVTGTPT